MVGYDTSGYSEREVGNAVRDITKCSRGRAIESCWAWGALPGPTLPWGHSSFLSGASRSKELIILSCTKLLLEL